MTTTTTATTAIRRHRLIKQGQATRLLRTEVEVEARLASAGARCGPYPEIGRTRYEPEAGTVKLDRRLVGSGLSRALTSLALISCGFLFSNTSNCWKDILGIKTKPTGENNTQHQHRTGWRMPGWALEIRLMTRPQPKLRPPCFLSLEGVDMDAWRQLAPRSMTTTQHRRVVFLAIPFLLSAAFTT